ncbi:MAG: hypothetical protein II187_06820, partial [Treponema sp.]|nr:hypothetical protein [Treponema sp.]
HGRVRFHEEAEQNGRSKETNRRNEKGYLSWSLHDHDVRMEGRQEGRNEGIAEKAREDARNLLAMNLGSLEQIAQAVGLSVAEVEQLAAQG